MDINGFEFLIFMVKRFTETVHANFRSNFVRYRE